MSVELEYLRMIPGVESVLIGLVISINGHAGRFVVEGALVPVEEPQAEPVAQTETTNFIQPQPEKRSFGISGVEDLMPSPKRKYKMRARKTQKASRPESQPKPQSSRWGMSWGNAIVEALKGGNLTSSELMQHACRIRGTAIPTGKDELAKFRSSFSVSLNDAKQAGRVRRIEENGIDKWSVA